MTSRFTPDNHRDGDSSGDRHDEVGWFRFIFETDRWEWSDEVFRLHGYPPGQLSPNSGLDDPNPDRHVSTEWVVAQCHQEDRDRIRTKIRHAREHPGPLSSRHRVVDARGQDRDAILVANSLCDHSGAVIGLQGLYIENVIPDTVIQQRITDEVEKIAKNREAIDQAKGMLMAIYGLSGDAAFRVLRGWSQTSNTKLHALAEQLVIDFTTLGTGKELPPRSAYQNTITTIRDRSQQSKSDS